MRKLANLLPYDKSTNVTQQQPDREGVRIAFLTQLMQAMKHENNFIGRRASNKTMVSKTYKCHVNN